MLQSNGPVPDVFEIASQKGPELEKYHRPTELSWGNIFVYSSPYEGYASATLVTLIALSIVGISIFLWMNIQGSFKQ